MTPVKLVLIGCDDNFALSALLRSIETVSDFSNHIISTTHIADLIGILEFQNPDLIIICFRNNQLVLNELHSIVGKPEIPLLCLSKPFEKQSLRWPSTSTVFVFQLEHLNICQYLVRMINSILRLKSVVLPSPDQPNNITETTVKLNKQDSDRNLGKYIMLLEQKSEMLSTVKNRIGELYKRVDDSTREKLIPILKTIKTSSHNNKLWDDFKVYFEQTDPNFLWLLAQKYPDLTPIDLKYCCYIKMNMSNDDIGNLLGINRESVRTHKYRLKKKMSLAKEQNLRNYLQFVQAR